MRKNLLWLVFFSLCFIFFLHPLERDGDFYHHLHTGKYVLENFALPHRDSWTFTASGKEWIAYAWGAGVIFYLIYQTFGLLGTSIFVATVALISLILLYLWLKSYSLPDRAVWPTLILAVALFSTRWPTRPEIFTYPFLIALFLIDRYREKYSKLVLLWPPVIWLWSITYGSSTVVGLLVLGLILAGQLIKDHFQIKPKQRLFYLAILGSFPLSLLNGYSYKSLFYIFFIPAVVSFQGEWLGILATLQKAPPQYLAQFLPRLLIYLSYLIFFLAAIIKNWKILKQYPLLALLSTTIFLPIIAFRQVPLATLLSLPIFSLAITKSNKLATAVSSLITLIILSTTLILLATWSNPPQLNSTENPTYSAIKNYLVSHQLFGRVYADQNLSSYLSFHLNHQVKVAYDTRDDLFLKSDILANLHSPLKNLNYLLSKYKVDVAVINLEEEGSGVVTLLANPSWKKLYTINQYEIFKFIKRG